MTKHTWIDRKAELALAALERDGWMEVEFLTANLGAELVAQAFGYTESYVSSNQRFSPPELEKLRLLGRIYAAISQQYDRDVVKNWLISHNPLLGEEYPLKVLATQQIGRLKLPWAEIQKCITDAVREFLLAE